MSVSLGSDDSLDVADIRDHYDQLSPLYRTFWGEHIHHGYWRGKESAEEAQLNLTRQLADRASVRPGERILDVGCGLGGSALVLTGDYGCFVEGISLSPKQIATATREAARRGLEERTAFSVRDANALEATEPTYDVIWTIECSEHLFDKPRFISTCARLLKPGGRLAICAWLAGDDLDASRRQLVEDVCRGMLCPSLGTMHDYEQWMTNADLEVLSAENITAHVAQTWDLCRPVLNFPLVKSLLAVSSPRLNAFANSFASISAAYRTGAMAYGMFVGRQSN